MNNLEKQIQAILFYEARPMSYKKLANLLNKKEEEITEALENLEKSLADSSLTLMKKEGEVLLAIHKDYSEIIDNIKKEELNRDLSKASLETLSIILYKSGASRSEIDFIRGVNSSFTLRALMIRGLVEKVASEEDSRKFIYKPTFDLLAFMGVKEVGELPNYNEVNTNLENSIKEFNEIENQNE